MLAVPMVTNIIAHLAHEHQVYAVSMSQHGHMLYQCLSMVGSRQSSETQSLDCHMHLHKAARSTAFTHYVQLAGTA